MGGRPPPPPPQLPPQQTCRHALTCTHRHMLRTDFVSQVAQEAVYDIKSDIHTGVAYSQVRSAGPCQVSSRSRLGWDGAQQKWGKLQQRAASQPSALLSVSVADANAKLVAGGCPSSHPSLPPRTDVAVVVNRNAANVHAHSVALVRPRPERLLLPPQRVVQVQRRGGGCAAWCCSLCSCRLCRRSLLRCCCAGDRGQPAHTQLLLPGV